jgi:predicted short-subunit dehydrogenase-like oxidoreductase (DUF2520 family)
MNTTDIQRNFSLFGASRVGIALAFHLVRCGWRPRFLWNRSSERLEQAARFVTFDRTTTVLSDIEGDGDWLIIAVRDDVIAEVAGRLAELSVDFRDKRVLHVSGFYDSSILRPLKACGAATGSLHPVLSVPTIESGIETLPTGVFTCEGEIRAELVKMVQEIGGRAYLLTPQQKKVVHVAAVFLNNYYLALTQALRQLGNQVGLESEDFSALLKPTLAQVIETFARTDAVQRITGPVARGDLATIQAHQELLSPYPQLSRLYQDYLNLVLQLLEEQNKKVERLGQKDGK